MPESAVQSAERKALARAAARRRQAVATLRLAEAVARYAADQVGNGLAPGQARLAAVEAAGELAELAAVLRKLALLPGERRELARKLTALGLSRRQVAVRLGVCEQTAKNYLGPHPGREP